MATRIVSAVNAAIEDGDDLVFRDRGDEVELNAEQEAKLDAADALVPKGLTLDEHLDNRLQAYRASHGDVQALAAQQAGKADIVDLSGETDTTAYVAYLEREKPTIAEVLGVVGDDPLKASSMLEAEQAVSGGQPRQGIVDHLTPIIEAE